MITDKEKQTIKNIFYVVDIRFTIGIFRSANCHFCQNRDQEC